MARLIGMLGILAVSPGCVLPVQRTVGWASDVGRSALGSRPAHTLWGPWAPPLSGHAARQSTWDRTGGNDDYIAILPGKTVTLFDAEGPGLIRHIWMTTNASGPVGRTVVLRMHWDGAEEAAVEVPLGDFFGVGHGMRADLNSWPITVASHGRALNCWWPMPFAEGARITVTNEGAQALGAFYCHVDYLALDRSPPTRERFHARFTQAHPADMPGNFVILETEGRGHHMGTVLSVDPVDPLWWGEGDDLIEVDGHEPLRGTGTEDYFGDAWSTRQHETLFHGTSVSEGLGAAHLRTTMYRFHIPDPIPFRERIRVSIEHGTENNRADNLSSVAFWYQEPPASSPPPLQPTVARLGGEEQQEFIRQEAWRLVTGEDPVSASREISVLLNHAESVNVSLLEGLMEYLVGKQGPDPGALEAMERPMARIEAIIEAMPEEERSLAREMIAPTDPDAPVPSQPLRGLTTLQRAHHDLARRLASARGHLEAGDEIVVEVRESSARLTPPPAFESTEEWAYSYAKVEDPHLMGAGAHFTHGDTDPSWARFTPNLPQGGRYEVSVIFSYGSNAGDTRYEVRHADGMTTTAIPQLGRPDTPGRNSDRWISLGTFRFEAGQDPDRGSVTLNVAPGTAIPNDRFEYRAYADAVRFIFRGE
jgi:hypothetical protein